ncbi:MAG: ribulose-phosphate 3-epimerase, partial [Elusimicrobia bacterium]|nr:ribulose-phosphate 3-epimerase [Elusimicrobiota bacterium]
TIGPVIVEAVRRHTKRPIKAHLMIENPWDYVDPFIKAGADIIGIHAECYGERRAFCREYGQYPKEVDVIDAQMMRRDIQRIMDAGARPCLVINPGTPVSCLDPVLDEVSDVLLMSVDPGFAGQKFKPEARFKIKELREQFVGDIAVDGGVNAETAPGIVKAGANVLVTASYFFNSPDPAGAVKFLKSLS